MGHLPWEQAQMDFKPPSWPPDHRTPDALKHTRSVLITGLAQLTARLPSLQCGGMWARFAGICAPNPGRRV